MAATTLVTVGKTWTKLADGSCLVQAKNNMSDFRVCVQSTQPDETATNFVTLNLTGATVLDFATPVYARLIHTAIAESIVVAVIA